MFLSKKENIRNIAVSLISLAVLFAVHRTPPAGLSSEGFKMLGIGLIAAMLWATEIVALPVTALSIIFLEIVLNIFSVSESLRYLAHPVNSLLFVGFCLAAGLRKYNLDRKISITIIRYAGTDVKKLLFYVMCATAFLSMWMSNTATVAVMIPIVAAILKMGEDTRKNLGKIFMIGIAYAGTIGGLATPVGATPNPVIIAFLDELSGVQLSFLNWVMIGMPFTVVLLPAAWFILVKIFPPEISHIKIKSFSFPRGKTCTQESLGEKKVLFYFILLILFWFAGSFIPVPSGWLYIVSIGGSVMMFLPFIGTLKWEDTKEDVNWGIMILVGGGLALGGGLVKTGAIDWLIGFFSGTARQMPLPLVVNTLAAISSLGTLVFCSITATSTTFIPIAIKLAGQLNANPVVFAATAGIASSFAFLLPANTPPNAIAYGSGYFKTSDMIKAGILLLISSIFCFALISSFIWPLFL